MVGFRGDYSPGTIVVKTNERRLYLVVDPGHAVRYPVGVGKSGKQWAGVTRISGKYRNPAWSPPAEVKRDKPSMPDVIPGGSPHNPMGVAAMTLAGGEYAIHGTNVPGSVGGFVSYGCIRMLKPISPTCMSAFPSAPPWWCRADPSENSGTAESSAKAARASAAFI